MSKFAAVASACSRGTRPKRTMSSLPSTRFLIRSLASPTSQSRPFGSLRVDLVPELEQVVDVVERAVAAAVARR